ncbi:DUF448 domain-containing protein [Sulfurimonas sp. MAG313]|nr:DUF448 domain-containing protein [Sulfurimonas sp. MAG313]
MARKLHVPIRMCLQCRQRFPQKELIRLQCKDKTIQAFDGLGRSQYVCYTCSENPKLVKQLAGRCKCAKDLHEEIISLLKELRADDR